ncbi:MAG: hypothetical protein IKT52_01160 [Oscillospiraceae bacterium]|nr:hypothetical protein [Oscillospiraceae bacterium]
MKRRIISLIVAMLVILAMPMQVLAAEHTVTTNEDAYNALTTDTDAQVTVNLNNNIDWQIGFQANEGQNYTINGNGNDISGLNVGGSGNVTVNADIVGSGDSSVEVHGSDVTVNGDITLTDTANDGNVFVTVMDGGSLTVDGDVDCDANINIKDSQMEITGNASAGMDVEVNGGDLTVGGDLSAGETIFVVQGGDLDIGSDVTAGNGIYIEHESTAKIDGNATTNNAESGILVFDSELTVSSNIDGEGALEASNSAVDVGGNVDRTYVTAYNGGELTVGGDITAEMSVNAGSEGKIEIDGSINSSCVDVMHGEITVGGNVNVVETVYADNSTVEISGNVTSEISNAIQATSGSTVTVGGDVVAGSATLTDERGTHAYGGVGVVAFDSTVTVEGNVAGGSVTADNITGINQGGMGIAAIGSAVVEVGGNVTGGDATKGNGVGGIGIYYEESDIPFTGSVTVNGTVSNGKSATKASEPVTEKQEAVAAPVEEPAVVISVGETPALKELTVTISETKDEIVIEELKEEELNTFLETLKETVKESNSDTVTINVSAHKEVSTVRIPTEVLKAIIETFGKLEIVFEGGTIIIDAAEFEKLVAELGFVIIKLK